MRRFAQNTFTARNFEISEAASVIVLANLRRDVMVCAKAMVKARSLAKRARQIGIAMDAQDGAHPVAQRCGWQPQSQLLERLLGLVGRLNLSGSGHSGSLGAQHSSRTATEPTTRGTTRFGFERGYAFRPERYRFSTCLING